MKRPLQIFQGLQLFRSCLQVCLRPARGFGKWKITPSVRFTPLGKPRRSKEQDQEPCDDEYYFSHFQPSPPGEGLPLPRTSLPDSPEPSSTPHTAATAISTSETGAIPHATTITTAIPAAIAGTRRKPKPASGRKRG